MKVIVGFIIVIGCTLGGYVAMGGHLKVLWQPFEVVIIVGAAIGAFVTANTKSVLKNVMPGIKAATETRHLWAGTQKTNRHGFFPVLQGRS